jgi:small-conductance mechanosensitive channel
MDNQNIQQPQSGPKGKATASFVFGIISIVCTLPFIFMAIAPAPQERPELSSVIIYLFWLCLIVAPLSFVLGLVFGFLGQKSTKKGLAKKGIVLSLFAALLFFISMFFLTAL